MGDQLTKKKNVIMNNAGELMIESCIIVSITIIMLFFIFALGILIYQKSLQSLVANETAEMIAKSYMTGQLSDEPISIPQSEDELTMFRFFYADDIKSICRLNATKYAIERLSQTSLAVINPSASYLQVKYCEDGRYLKLVEVDLSVQYEFLFGSLFTGAINGFKLNNGVEGTSLMTLTSSGSASATDISSYINSSKAQVRAMDYIYDGTKGLIGEDAMDTFEKLYSQIKELFDRFK